MESPLQYYYSHPINNKQPLQYDFCHHIGNPLCGDDLTLYVQLTTASTESTKATDGHPPLDPETTIVKDMFFDGEVSLITKATTSFFIELSQGTRMAEILGWDFGYLHDQGMEVSTRRQRSAITGLLACINGWYAYNNIDIIKDFDDILPQE